MATPTPAQIKQVQTNLTNMQSLNDYVYNQGQSKVINAYLLLTEPDTRDPGLEIGLNLIEAIFKGIGSVLGPIGTFVANFVSGMVNDWATNTPPSLNGTFASMEIRLQQTSLAVDKQLAEYFTNTIADWDTSFTYDGQTTKLSDLSTAKFPAETDPEFETMAAACLVTLDQEIWTTVMKANFIVTLWELSSGNQPMPGTESDPPVSWDEMFIKQNPAYYNTWSWHNSSGCGDSTGWLVNEYNLGTGAGVFTDGSMSDGACAYLFIDSANGVVINKDGLFPRKTVFTGLGIKQTTHIVADSGYPPMPLSKKYLMAMKAGKTLTKLLETDGRPAVEKRILDKAAADPVFRNNLAYHPHQTLEAFLGIAIPEAVCLNITVEKPNMFGLVIPQQLADDHPGKAKGHDKK